MEISVQVDFGKDLGQNFGTLFEAVDAQGRVVAGAGFPGLYNTTCRNDRRGLQFYLRPAQDAVQPRIDTLPRFSDDTGVYVGDINGRMYALGQRVAARAQAWDPAAGRWEVAPEYADAGLRNGDGEMHLGGGRLTFKNSRIEHDGALILAAPEKESIHHVYYAMGYLFIDDAALAEYGLVHRLMLPGHLSCQTRWVDGPTEFRFVVADGRMSVSQDGVEIASAPLDAGTAAGLKGASVTYGSGLFGPLAGKLLCGASR